MARGFGATLGAGTTDSVALALATAYTVRSWSCWLYKNGEGGGNIGRIFDCNGTEVFQNNENNVANTFRYSFGGAAGGAWDSADVANNTWSHVGISYDTGSIANDPIVYLSGSKLTVGSGLTEIAAPVLAAPVAATYYVGNRADGTRNWDGMIAEFAVWDAILTDGEFAALAKGYAPAMVRLQSLVEYVPMVRANISVKGAAPTITGTAIKPHPRVIMPAKQRIKMKFITAGFLAARARQTNLPVLGTGLY